MGKLIQAIKTAEDNSLYIIRYNAKTNELTFKVSREPKQIQKEIVFIKNGLIFTNLYRFSIGYLNKFLMEQTSK